MRQTVLLVPGENYNGPRRPPMVKEVETFCTYDRQPDGSFTGVQRTATFLVPDAAYTSGASLAEQQVRGSRQQAIALGRPAAHPRPKRPPNPSPDPNPTALTRTLALTPVLALARARALNPSPSPGPDQAIQLLRGPDGMQTAIDVRLYSLLYERA